MRAKIDETKCQGHTLCALVAPEVYRIREQDAVASVLSEVIAPAQEAQAKLGANGCPERAIIIEE